VNTSEKESLREVISRFILRLEELSRRDFEFEEGWERIYTNVKAVHDKFREVVEAYILQCQSLLGSIDTSPWPYTFFNNFVEHLYRCSFMLRTLYPFLFSPQSPNRLYYYLFLDELLHCFPEIQSMPSNIKYIMMATGNVAHWPIQEMLVGRIRAFEQFLIPEVRARLQDVNATTISGFECDFQEPLDRQMVLAHEFFHVLVDQNPNLETEFNNISTDASINSVFIGADHPLNSGHIEELFCDFAAVWFFGPAYAKAFIEEILFRGRERTSTHPHRVVR
jgi:hypothetical protein